MKVCKVFFREKELNEKKKKRKEKKRKEKKRKRKLSIIYFIINDYDYSLFSLKL